MRSAGLLGHLSPPLPSIIRRLSQFETADPAHAPMVAAVLMAAVLGQDTLAWRDQFGQIPPAESSRPHLRPLAAVLLDFTNERPGTTDQLMRETFASLAAGPIS
ncbi:hypothetical protein [Streptomyces sp. NBC_01718]|uniref:hypothetical protein n=1 Tax=Streptomyces sp. NBC_01718 TaxID=2975919 RepID=UPI00352EE8B4